ncbi:MAG: ATP-binding cassette domain-containing protein [Ruminococcaceae bacterium]|nr:ATP-binding cassette domain-containing protein [Oscillospiraceae bacterium]
MIKLDNVSKFYYSKGVIAVGFSKVNLSFKMGEFVAITGESGSGKSTLLNVISGLDSYEEGEMYVNGLETSHYSEKDFEDYRRRYIGNIFQDFNLVNSYTVFQNIELVLLLNGMKKRDAKKRVNELIEQVGLTGYSKTKASKLSGGQKQRVAIARALAKDTPIIIADEPTGSLDVESAKGIIELLAEVAKNKLVIVVTHNFEQVKPYVTRKIKMHDGKILEDIHLKEPEVVEDVPETSYKDIRPLSQLLLGVRNAFNIPVKFLLLVFVFLFIAVSLSTELAIFKHERFENSVDGYNWIFNSTDAERIIIKKNDESPILKSDLEEIEKLQNVDKVVETDLMVESYLGITDDKNFYFHGNAELIDEFDGKIDVGRMPENSKEILIAANKKNYFFEGKPEDIIDKKVRLFKNVPREEGEEYVVVGISFIDDFKVDEVETLYISQELIDQQKIDVHKEYSFSSINFDNGSYEIKKIQYYEQKIIPSERVKKGEAFVSEEFNGFVKKGTALGKNINISVTNKYYTDSVDLKVSKVYTLKTFKSITGIDLKDNEWLMGAIFVNPEDLNALYDKPTYQSSVFATEAVYVDEIATELQKLGYDTLALKDARVTDATRTIMRIMTLFVTAGLAILLTIIGYFVIRIILRSRNVYYSTIRMLGANERIARILLILDLFVVANIAYVLTMGGIWAFVEYAPKNFLTRAFSIHMGFPDYAAIYMLVAGISFLISNRYSKSLFKKSAISTYIEEV